MNRILGVHRLQGGLFFEDDVSLRSFTTHYTQQIETLSKNAGMRLCDSKNIFWVAFNADSHFSIAAQVLE